MMEITVRIRKACVFMEYRGLWVKSGMTRPTFALATSTVKRFRALSFAYVGLAHSSLTESQHKLSASRSIVASTQAYLDGVMAPAPHRPTSCRMAWAQANNTSHCYQREPRPPPPPPPRFPYPPPLPPPKLRSCRGRASLTLMERPSISLPLSAVIAA